MDAMPVERTAKTSAAVTAQSIVSLALANVGGSACGKNSLGGTTFETSCTGNGGQPEYWCADFAQWVWANAGAQDTDELDAAAGSFYVYGQNHGTLSNTPQLGSAVVFDYQGNGVADHVAIVTQVNSDGTIETVSGDWNGENGTEAQFASTSSVVLNTPAYASTVGTAPSVMGMTISGYIAPVGLSSADYGASFGSQSFPFATSALTMTAGQVIPSYIELRNIGAKSWDSNTRIGTTGADGTVAEQDTPSPFADSTWISNDRPAEVSGSVAPGDTFKFQFDLKAPDTPGTYYQYFGVVEDGVAWFSAAGQAGPPDNQLEVQIKVVLPEGGLPTDEDAGTPKDDEGGPGVSGEDAGIVVQGSGGPGVGPGSGGGTQGAPGPGDGSGAGPGPKSGGGCAVGVPVDGTPPWASALVGLILVGGGARTARRRRARSSRGAGTLDEGTRHVPTELAWCLAPSASPRARQSSAHARCALWRSIPAASRSARRTASASRASASSKRPIAERARAQLMFATVSPATAPASRRLGTTRSATATASSGVPKASGRSISTGRTMTSVVAAPTR